MDKLDQKFIEQQRLAYMPLLKRATRSELAEVILRLRREMENDRFYQIFSEVLAQNNEKIKNV